jgi:hypothetical protein
MTNLKENTTNTTVEMTEAQKKKYKVQVKLSKVDATTK